MTDSGSDDAAYQGLLQPGERLWEHGEVSLALGGWGPVAEWNPIEVRTPGWLDRLWAFGTRKAARKVVFFTLLSPLMLFAWIDSIGGSLSSAVERLVGGVVSAGHRGSLARQAQQALSALGAGANELVVTDRRILLVRRGLFGSTPDRTAVWAIPRTAIAAARRRPRGLARRRVELSFADRSRIVLALPALRSPRPDRLATVLTYRG
jgi:hypothetical protein